LVIETELLAVIYILFVSYMTTISVAPNTRRQILG
jgi:hypothetical protein